MPKSFMKLANVWRIVKFFIGAKLDERLYLPANIRIG
jgi:hypothetical protein